MEEILASIRRIISEEEQTPNAAPVLDLTQTDEPAPAPAPVQQTVAPSTPDDDIVFEAVEQAVAEEETPVPEPVVTAPQPRPVAADPQADVILSTPVASQAAGSLARLAGTLRISEAPGQTVEGVVRELLKPMLKEWLDRNLAAIVEARVEAELERIARMSR